MLYVQQKKSVMLHMLSKIFFLWQVIMRHLCLFILLFRYSSIFFSGDPSVMDKNYSEVYSIFQYS